MSQIQKEKNEAVTLGKAFVAVAIMVWTAFPIFVLGALVSAVYRHPTAEEAINGEAVYWLIGQWQGGITTLPMVVPLMFLCPIILIISYWASVKKNIEPAAALPLVRSLTRKIILPTIVSTAAFMSGFRAQESTETLVLAMVLLLCFAVPAAVVHYFVDTTEKIPVKTPQNPKNVKRSRGNKKSR